MKKKVAIVGFGRFGKTWFRFLGNDFEVKVYNKEEIDVGEAGIKSEQILNREEEIFESKVIFYCVPISRFEEVIKGHRKFFTEKHLLVDVLSVKVWPRGIFEEQLKGIKTGVLLTHPMFGPDSSKVGFGGLKIVVDKFRCGDEDYRFWKGVFSRKGLEVVEMMAEEHDRLAANSQGLTHFIGRMLDEFGMEPTNIDTLGAKKLLEVKEQTCNDSWELFLDLQKYNPFTKEMRARLGKAYKRVFSRLV